MSKIGHLGSEAIHAFIDMTRTVVKAVGDFFGRVVTFIKNTFSHTVAKTDYHARESIAKSNSDKTKVAKALRTPSLKRKAPSLDSMAPAVKRTQAGQQEQFTPLAVPASLDILAPLVEASQEQSPPLAVPASLDILAPLVEASQEQSPPLAVPAPLDILAPLVETPKASVSLEELNMKFIPQESDGIIYGEEIDSDTESILSFINDKMEALDAHIPTLYKNRGIRDMPTSNSPSYIAPFKKTKHLRDQLESVVEAIRSDDTNAIRTGLKALSKNNSSLAYWKTADRDQIKLLLKEFNIIS